MKKILLFIIVLLLLAGAGLGVYHYVLGGALPWDEPQEVALTEEVETVEPLHLAEIRSFKVPVLHNSVAVKFLVFGASKLKSSMTVIALSFAFIDNADFLAKRFKFLFNLKL